MDQNLGYTEKVSVHQIEKSPATSGPRIGPSSRRVQEAINSTDNVYNNNNNNNKIRKKYISENVQAVIAQKRTSVCEGLALSDSLRNEYWQHSTSEEVN